MAFAGLRGTGDWGVDERPKNFRELILWRNPNGSAPLTALLAKMKSESTDDPEFAWWEEENNLIRIQEDTGLNTTSTTLDLSSGGLDLVKGDVLLVDGDQVAAYANEIVMVSSVTSDTVVEIIRAQAGTTAANIPITSFLTRIGSSFAEGTRSPDVSARNPLKLKNFCQIFKTAYELTETTKVTRARTGDPLKNDKKRRMFDHSVNLELAFMFGKAFEDTGPNGKPRRFTGGASEFITTNRKIYVAATTEDNILDDIFKVFDYEAEAGANSNERLVFAGNTALNVLNKIARDSASTRINFDGVVSTYGMDLQRWILPQGTLFIRTHPLMNTHALYAASMFVLNPPAMVYRFLRDTKPMDHIEGNDEDTHKGQWLSEVGLEFRHEKTMAYLGQLQ